MKDTITITVPVDPGVAEYFSSASDVERRKIQMMGNSFLHDMMELVTRRQEAEAARGEYWTNSVSRRR